jgi:putative oxidoreductase
MDWLKKYDNVYLLVGRTLLGLYFLVFGALKVPTYFDTLSLMISKGVPLSGVLLPITIIIQVLAGFFLIIGQNLRISSLLLVGLTFLINIFIHDFWNLTGDPSQAHEAQNFIKNLGIIAGLFVLATIDKKA